MFNTQLQFYDITSGVWMRRDTNLPGCWIGPFTGSFLFSMTINAILIGSTFIPFFIWTEQSVLCYCGTEPCCVCPPKKG